MMSYPCILVAGGNAQAEQRKGSFHKHQEKISKKHNQYPTYIKWELKDSEFIAAKSYPNEPCFRGDEAHQDELTDTEVIDFDEQWARSEAYRLHKEVHKIKELSDEEFFVTGSTGGDSQRTIMSFSESDTYRNYIVDSGASFHLVSLDSLNAKEQATMKSDGKPIPITTANGEIKIQKQVRVYVKELDIFVWAYVLDGDVAVLSLGMLCDDEGFTYSWVPNRPPTLTRDGLTVTCHPSHNVPVIFPAASAEGNPEDDDTSDSEAGMPDMVDDSTDEEEKVEAKEEKKQKKTRRRKKKKGSQANASDADTEGNLEKDEKKRSRP
jgi:hypothetical protein